MPDKYVRLKMKVMFLLMFLLSCGKDASKSLTVIYTEKTDDNSSNENATDPQIASSNTYTNPYTNSSSILGNVGPINSIYSYGGRSVNEVLSENPCISGFNNSADPTKTYNGDRYELKITIKGYPSVINKNEFHVGVNSFGDVSLLVGQGEGNDPLFIGYLCPRPISITAQVQFTDLSIGTYSKCAFKPITRATLLIPGSQSILFRWMDGGTSTNKIFTSCQ